MISIISPQGPAPAAPHLDSLAQRVDSVASQGHLLLPAWVSTFKRWDLWTIQSYKVIGCWKRAPACKERSGLKRQKSRAVHFVLVLDQDVCWKSGWRRAEASSEARNGVIVGAAFTKFIFCPRWTVNHNFLFSYRFFLFLNSYFFHTLSRWTVNHYFLFSYNFSFEFLFFHTLSWWAVDHNFYLSSLLFSEKH